MRAIFRYILSSEKIFSSHVSHRLPSKVELENVFVKHYVPNHIPNPKREWNIDGNHSVVDRLIYLSILIPTKIQILY